MKKIILVLLVVSVCKLAFAQDTSISKYLPLQVGNVWVYHYSCSGTSGNGNGSCRIAISGNTYANGKTYYVFQQSFVIISGNSYCISRLFGDTSHALRVDSLSCNIYWKDPCGTQPEALIDSLRSRLGDTAKCCYGDDICIDTTSYQIFGSSFQARRYNYYFGIYGNYFPRYAKNLGLITYEDYSSGGNCFYTLNGCKINGVTFGDTTLTGMNEISSAVPNGFSLYQNYPNPFNPTTKIKFSVAPPLGLPSPSRVFDLSGGEAEGVRLAVYDALGREVATLVNEKLNPGTYEVEWDASNFSSGVYFYKLETGGFVQTRKMVLMK